jgi:hypothetical protein
MDVYIDGKLCITGNHRGLTNPSVEIGIMYSRVLLEFLGLKANQSKTKLIEIRERKDDDIGIEDFLSSSGPLKKVSIADALSCYKGSPADAELGLVTIIAHADKAIAHLTEGPVQDAHTLGLVELGSKGVLALMCRHLYVALGRPNPDYEIKTKR